MIYKGVLGLSRKKNGSFAMKGIPLRAYQSWRGQKERCSNPDNKAYKHYGAKGIQVRYTSREFVSWWIPKAKKYSFKIRLTVDRIDSNKDYCFSNIRLIPWAENVRESNARRTVHTYKVYCLDSGKLLSKHERYSEIMQIYPLNSSSISRHLREKPKKSRYQGSVTVRRDRETF